MISQPIFKRDTTGKIRTWQFEVEGAQWRTIAGVQGGNAVTSGWTICTPKSKATAEEQAEFEARAEQKKKLDRDYRETIEDVDRKRASVVKPMLANKFETFPGPCFSQPKLDGVRCIATKDGLWSRQGKPILGVPHIITALAPMFAKDPDVILDGELYNHDLKDDFNSIVSIVKKQKPTEAEIAKSAATIQYHVYDAPSGCVFRDRCREVDANLEIYKIDPSIVVPVRTSKIDTATDLDDLYAAYISDGYEGQMVRLNGAYEQKRSKQLLKRKEFQDDEFEVVRIEEGLGNWAGYGKRAVLKMKDGREFGAGVKGNQEFARGLLTGPTPKTATIRFFALTPDGVPRFPIAVAFYDAERI